MSLISKIKSEIETHRLITAGQRIVIGVSGGADSVALLYALHYLSQPLHFEISVAHLHHGTRAEASDGDRQFVQELCWSLNLPCITQKIDVPALARQNSRSLEMEARIARHALFGEALQRTHAAAVALAHTADDQAETFLLKLGRGAGLRGLGGMSREQELDGIRVIRPMLDVARTEIESFLTRHKLTWREDASNTDPKYKRNCVRHEILPFLEEKLNPNIRQTLLRTMDILREEDEWVSSIANTYLKNVSSPDGEILFGEKLAPYPPAARRRIIMNWLLQNGVPAKAVDFERVQRIDQLLESQDGSRAIQLTDPLRVVNQYGNLIIKAHDNPPPQFELTTQSGHGFAPDAAKKIGDYPSTATLNPEMVGDRPLVIRTIREGDRMQPLGMAGSRKLQDILVDEKVPRERRAQLPVVECNGEIVWLPGYRIAEAWKVPTRTSPSLHLTLTQQHRS
jgi:tRNA(Ile)-lysidine synthase